MVISLIVAMDERGIIGNQGKLPWGRIPEDMRWFQRHTLGRPVIMGRKTFESIGKALIKRMNIILTRDREYTATKCIVVHSVEESLAAARSAIETGEKTEKNPEVIIAGGAEIYKLFLPHAERIYLTIIFGSFAGDIFFPLKTATDWIEWHSTNREYAEPDDTCRFKLTFDTLVKI